MDALPLTQIKHDPPVGAELFGLICINETGTNGMIVILAG
jgi:hypothetical protein